MPTPTLVPRLGLTAALLGALLIAGAPPASANPPDSQRDSLSSQVESFAAWLKAETERATREAAKAAERADWAFDTLKDRLTAELDALDDALSGQKVPPGTFGEEFGATIEAWREEATKSWSELHRSALDALGRLTEWWRKQSVPDDRTEVPV